MRIKKDRVLLLNKEVVKYIKDKAKVSDKDVNGVIGALSDFIMINVAENKDVFVKGIGIFSNTMTKPRQIRDINTGNKFYINGRRVIKYKTVAKIKNYLKENFKEENDI